MTLGFAAALLAAAMIGIALACKYLQKSRAARTLCIVGCALIALACAVCIGLTLLFVDAVRNSLPTA